MPPLRRYPSRTNAIAADASKEKNTALGRANAAIWLGQIPHEQLSSQRAGSAIDAFAASFPVGFEVGSFFVVFRPQPHQDAALLMLSSYSFTRPSSMFQPTSAPIRPPPAAPAPAPARAAAIGPAMRIPRPGNAKPVPTAEMAATMAPTVHRSRHRCRHLRPLCIATVVGCTVRGLSACAIREKAGDEASVAVLGAVCGNDGRVHIDS